MCVLWLWSMFQKPWSVCKFNSYMCYVLLIVYRKKEGKREAERDGHKETSTVSDVFVSSVFTEKMWSSWKDFESFKVEMQKLQVLFMLLADMLLKSLAYGLPYLVSEIFDFAASFSLNLLDLISYQIQTSHKFLSSWGREFLSSQVSSNPKFCWKGSGEDPNRPSHIFEFPWISGSWWCLEKHFEGWQGKIYFFEWRWLLSIYIL